MKRLILIIFILAALTGCGGSDTGKLVKEGKQHFSEQNYNGAIVVFKSVLEKAPEKSEARLGLARSYLMVNKYDKAQNNFDKYLLQNPYDKKIYIDLGKIAFHNKNFIKSIEFFKQYNEAYPKSVEGHILLGQGYFFSGNNNDAIKSFDVALKLDPVNTKALLGKARALLAEGKNEEGYSLISSVLEHEVLNHEALYLSADREAARGNLQAYNEVFKKIYQSYPNDTYAAYIVAKGLVKEQKFEEALTVAKHIDNVAPQTGFGKKIVGLVFYQQKKNDQAINAYMEAVAVSPDPETYYMLGVCNYESGDFETAISYLRKALDTEPEFAQARELNSLILLRQKRFAESIAESQKVLETNPNNQFARMTLGDAYFAMGERDKAISEYEKVAQINPHISQAYLKLGAAHFYMGDISKTETALQDAVGATPEDIQPKIVLSAFYLRNGQNDKAHKVLAEGLTGSKKDSIIYALIARMDLLENKYSDAKSNLSKAIKSNNEDITPYLMLATMDLAEKKPEEALEKYDQILKIKPELLRGLTGKAEILDMLKRYDEAETYYKQALKSNDPKVFIRYANSKAHRGDLKKALEILEQGKAVNPTNLRIYQSLASILFDMKKYKEVLELCNDIDQIDQGAALGLRIRIYMIMGDKKKGIATAKQIIEFFPKEVVGYMTLYKVYSSIGDSQNAYNTLVEAQKMCGPEQVIMTTFSGYFSERGEYKKALNYVDAAIKRNQQDFTAYTIKGNIYLKMGEKEKAVSCFKKSLQISDRYIPALNNLAMLYAKNPQTSLEAMRMAYTAYMQQPLDPTVLDTFGYTLVRNGRAKEAIPVLEKALSLNSNDPAISYHLGVAYLKSGRNGEALSSFKKTVECKDCEESQEAAKLIVEISKKISKHGGKE